jgi:ribokinase
MQTVPSIGGSGSNHVIKAWGGIMNKQKIVVIGSLNMDLVVTMDRMPKVGETISGRHISYIPGGKGANQAVGCARLGADVLMVGSVGNDSFGRLLHQDLSDNGIHMKHVRMEEGVATGTATILQMNENNCIVVVQGANGFCSVDRVEEVKEEIQKAALLLVQLEIPLETVQHALKIAGESGVKTILNPAPAQPLSPDILQYVDYLTPNETEFELLCGKTLQSEADIEAAMGEWEDRHRLKVVLTRGEKGASFLEEGSLRTVPAIKVDAVDTTGAGDAFHAGFCMGICQSWSLEQAVRFAARTASLSVTRFGAQSGMPTRAEVETFEFMGRN